MIVFKKWFSCVSVIFKLRVLVKKKFAVHTSPNFLYFEIQDRCDFYDSHFFLSDYNCPMTCKFEPHPTQFILSFHHNSQECKNHMYNMRRVGIPLTGLTPPHSCTCPKPKSGFPMPYMVLFVFYDLRWEASSFYWYW